MDGKQISAEGGDVAVVWWHIQCQKIKSTVEVQTCVEIQAILCVDSSGAWTRSINLQILSMILPPFTFCSCGTIGWICARVDHFAQKCQGDCYI